AQTWRWGERTSMEYGPEARRVAQPTQRYAAGSRCDPRAIDIPGPNTVAATPCQRRAIVRPYRCANTIAHSPSTTPVSKPARTRGSHPAEVVRRNRLAGSIGRELTIEGGG